MEYEIDVCRLRRDMKDYYGTAMFNASPLAVMELTKVENATPEELIQIALKNKIDLSNYQINTIKY